MRALAERVGGLAGWRAALLAPALGALAATAFPPTHVLPALLLGFTPLLWLVDGTAGARRAFLLGWLFGFGHLVVALHWIGYAFLVDAERFGAMMPLAVAALAGGLALFPAAAVLAAWWARPPGWQRLLALAVAWSAAEWLRGNILSGFPWDQLGLVWIVFEPTAQGYAYFGVLGLSFLTVLAAGAPACVRRRRDLVALALLALLLPLGYGLGAWRLAAAAPAEVPGVRLRLVQANISQRQKWRHELRAANFRRYLELSGSDGWAGITQLIWPETATPFLLADDPAARQAIRPLLAGGRLLLTGTPVREASGAAAPVFFNSLLALDGRDRIVARYDKHHLVPFGEYLPARPLLTRLGLSALAASGVDYSAGPGPAVLTIDGLPPFQPLICYEAIFAEEIARPRPAWLLNLTNDAWFGPGAGPRQHFDQARVRAIEQGVPLVRVAGTGISAVVDPWGRVLARLEVGVAGVLDAALPAALPEAPLYARTGDLWLLPALFWFVGAGLWRRRRPPP